MAQITTVRITYGTMEAILELSYRWYVSKDDPWKLIKGMHVVPYGGFWWDRSFFPGDEDRMLKDKEFRDAMLLKKFDRKKVGSSGTGVFYGLGAKYNIPKYAQIKWEITDFD